MKIIKNIIMGISLTVITLNFTGCGAVPVYQIGTNQYTSSSKDRNALYKSATEHCISKGLFMKPIEERAKKRVGVGRDYYIDFKCLNNNSKEYNTYTSYKKGSDVSIGSDINIKSKSTIEYK